MTVVVWRFSLTVLLLAAWACLADVALSEERMKRSVSGNAHRNTLTQPCLLINMESSSPVASFHMNGNRKYVGRFLYLISKNETSTIFALSSISAWQHTDVHQLEYLSCLASYFMDKTCFIWKVDYNPTFAPHILVDLRDQRLQVYTRTSSTAAVHIDNCCMK